MVRDYGHASKHFGLTLCIVSDTHLYKPILPKADVLIHCGDLTNKGTLSEMTLMNNWLLSIKQNYPKGIIYVPGNHDWLPYNQMEAAKVTMNAVTLLHNTEVVIDGCCFYGTAFQPQFLNWAFNLSESDLDYEYSKIPYYTDVLITHTPPFGVLDKSTEHGLHLGSKALSNAIAKVKPRLNCFGHVHGSYGIATIENTTYVNGAICTEQYQPENQPIVLEV